MRLGLMTLTAAMLLAPAIPASAEWQLKPFAALTFGGNASVLDLDNAAGKVKTAIGISGGYWGNIIGVEGDFGYVPGFFQNEIKGVPPKVLKSRVTTLTGNVTLSLPRHM